LSYLKKHGHDSVPIFTDSVTAKAWVRDKKAKTKLERTANNAVLFELIARAENWLKTNTYNNPILKWDTENLGDIPADFGRKIKKKNNS
jgi:ribonuclease HI